MHRATVFLAAILAISGCSKPRVPDVATIEEQDAPLKSAIRARDPVDEPQFVSGFYTVEPDGWRWTRGKFTVVLLAPPSAKTEGAVLELSIDAPQVVLDQVGPVTVSASIGGVALAPETRTHPGIATYRREVPAAAFPHNETLVNFTLDKVVKPYTLPGEDRELGVAIHAVALQPAGAQAKLGTK